MKISLKTVLFHQGHRYEPGDIVDLAPGEDGPYSNGVPMFEVVDEQSWNERQEMNARHAKEAAELTFSIDKADPHQALAQKHADERAELSRKHAAKALQLKHEREQAKLEANHEAQKQALAERGHERVAVPRERSPAELDVRQKAEVEALAVKQKAEVEALEARDEAAAEAKKAAEPAPAPKHIVSHAETGKYESETKPPPPLATSGEGQPIDATG